MHSAALSTQGAPAGCVLSLLISYRRQIQPLQTFRSERCYLPRLWTSTCHPLLRHTLVTSRGHSNNTGFTPRYNGLAVAGRRSLSEIYTIHRRRHRACCAYLIFLLRGAGAHKNTHNKTHPTNHTQEKKYSRRGIEEGGGAQHMSLSR